MAKDRLVKRASVYNLIPTNDELLSVFWNLLLLSHLDLKFMVMSGHVFLIPIQSQNKLVVASIGTAGKDDCIQMHFITNT